jgi:hypothetical protein
LAAVFASLALSVKYTGIFLFVPIIIATYLGSAPKAKPFSRLRSGLMNLVFPLGIAVSILMVVNLSALLEFELFKEAIIFNSNNYGNFSGGFVSNLTYYLVTSYGISFGLLSLPLILMGLFHQYKKNSELFLVLVSFPMTLMLYLSTLGLALNRNISITLPFIVVSLTAAIKLLVSKFANGGFKVRIVVSTFIALVVGFGAGQFFYSLHRDFQKDSSILAHNWIGQNLNRSMIIGINSGCSGESPADGLGFVTVNDPEISQRLPIYVLNAYWENPFTPYYRDSRPFWLELDQKYIHFYHFADRRMIVSPIDKSSFEELVPVGYVLEESFTSNGPDILILRRITE